MKIKYAHFLPVIALASGVLLYGCSGTPSGPPKEVTIQVDDRMRFDVTKFDVKPGQTVSVTLKNVGTAPKFSMGHNFVLLQQGIFSANVSDRFLNGAATEAAHDYVPPSSGNVIAHTKLLGPGESDTITFNAPQASGEYLYVCSFPGHYTQGARGIMKVE
jgi:azurin